MWKMHLGVHTRLVNEEWKVFVANRRQGRLTQIVRGGWIADWPDAANFLDLLDRKSTRLNSSHVAISYAVFCLKKKNRDNNCTLIQTKKKVMNENTGSKITL